MSTRARLDEALSRLVAGHPEVTDGSLTVSNLCREAGVDRDSFYHTNNMAGRLAAAQSNTQVHRPEVAVLRDEVILLKAETQTAVKDRRAHLADLERTIQIYANQIQVLALANQALTKENRQLRERLEHQESDVIQLADRR